MKLKPLLHYLQTPVDAASLVYFRIVFAAIMLWEVWRYWSNDWIARFYILPDFHFKYYGFEWVEPWPGSGMYWHFVVMAILATCMLVGFMYRLAALLFFFAFTYIFLLDQTKYLNHFYLVCLIALVMPFLPANRYLSIDAWLRPKLRSATVPRWAPLALIALTEVMLIYAGVVKINHDWLHLQPLTMWLGARHFLPVIGPYMGETWLVAIASYYSITLHILGAPLMLWRKTRFWVFWFYVTFHLSNVVLFNIGIFPWLTIATTLMFFDPDWPRQFWRWLGSPDMSLPKPSPPLNLPPEPMTPATAATLLFLGVFLLFNVLYPLRHYLYPGDVAWTEEGHRFAWRMKLRSKHGVAQFTVRDPDTGREWEVNEREFLTSRQAGKMAKRPDMTLQFAHFIDREWQRRHNIRDPEVYVRCFLSLNGRDLQLYIDPERDLSKVKRELWPPADWILPMTNPLPPVVKTGVHQHRN